MISKIRAFFAGELDVILNDFNHLIMKLEDYMEVKKGEYKKHIEKEKELHDKLLVVQHKKMTNDDAVSRAAKIRNNILKLIEDK